MKTRRNSQRLMNSETIREGEEVPAVVKVQVLAGINNVKTCGPEQHNEPQQQRRQANVAAHRDPGPDWCHSQAKTQHEMGEMGKSFRVGISKQDYEHWHRKTEAERIQLVGSQNKDEAR